MISNNFGSVHGPLSYDSTLLAPSLASGFC
jgi:hypothetical protein